MRKRIVIAILLIALPVSCFAAVEAFLKQLSHCYVIDLESNQFRGHSTDAGYSGDAPSTSSSSSNKYYENQILSVVGIHGMKTSGESVTLSMQLKSGEWCYVLDERYKRPFGVDVFARGSSVIAGADVDIAGYSMHLGSQINSENGTSSVTIPADIVEDYDAIWWDACIVLDPITDTSSNTCVYDGVTYYMTPSDSYYTAVIELTVSCGEVSQSYELYLQGYYKSESIDPGTSSCSMNITKLATANTLDIKTLFGTSEKYPVATYGMTTSSVFTPSSQTAPTGTVSLFLSSSNNAVSSNPEEFTLRHVSTNGTISYRDTSHNAVKYYAHITSTRGSQNNDGSTRTVQYDGTDYYGNASTSSRYVVIGPEHKTDQDAYRTTRWYDSGTISVSIPDNQTINGDTVTLDGLIAGQYTSNIYVHIVTDL